MAERPEDPTAEGTIAPTSGAITSGAKRGVQVVGSPDARPKRHGPPAGRSLRASDASSSARSVTGSASGPSGRVEPGDDVEVGEEVDVGEQVLEEGDSSGPAMGADHSARLRRRRGPMGKPRSFGTRRAVLALCVIAVLGIAGTIGFGTAWAGLNAKAQGEAQARATASSFIVDLTNFNAKNVDSDFSHVSALATGTFAHQARQVFGSPIRLDLQKALASSRGQVRDLYVQSYSGSTASVYAVVDQTYVNDKMKAPAADVLRVVLELTRTAQGWRVSDVTVLQGPSPTSPGPS